VLRQLEKAIHDMGLSDLKDRIRASALPTVTATTDDRKPAVGSSRLGGLPDLPPTIAWPRKDDGYFLFVGQIDLSELPPVVPGAPATGRLYFFVGLDEPSYDVEHRVFFHRGPVAELVPSVPPPTKTPVNPEYTDPFPAVPLSFSSAFSLPDFSTDPALDDLHDELVSLRDNLLYPGECRLFGHPEYWSGDPCLEAHLCASGLRDILFDVHQTMDEAQARLEDAYAQGETISVENMERWFSSFERFHARRDWHLAEARHWQLLFQVSSVRAAEMCWWDAGLLNFLIDGRDLATADFSKTYACILSS